MFSASVLDKERPWACGKPLWSWAQFTFVYRKYSVEQKS